MKQTDPNLSSRFQLRSISKIFSGGNDRKSPAAVATHTTRHTTTSRSFAIYRPVNYKNSSSRVHTGTDSSRPHPRGMPAAHVPVRAGGVQRPIIGQQLHGVTDGQECGETAVPRGSAHGPTAWGPGPEERLQETMGRHDVHSGRGSGRPRP